MDKNIIIGTAGHIDHGKTSLIRAITNKNTDRLKEEQERGISIELGFSYFDLPKSGRVGIIDVPGHEKFIKHMLAGVSGIDMVIFVIAADEGIMLQTKEHLDILRLLDINKGLIVLTKIDLVDDEFKELVKEEIKEEVRGTFLENSKILEVDSISKKGIDELVREIDDFSKTIEKQKYDMPVRMPIDRVFTVKGFGTVVTGTLMEGTIYVEDNLTLLPKNNMVRIRNIQSYGENSDKALAGQRVALNIANLKKEDINRGDLIATEGSIFTSKIINGKIKVLKSYNRIIENRVRIKLYHDSNESVGRMVILDKEALESGDEAYIQLRMEEDVAIKNGDKTIVRLYSPMETIGGITILDVNPNKSNPFDKEAIEDLILKETGDIGEIIEKNIINYKMIHIDKLNNLINMEQNKIYDEIKILKNEGKVILINDYLISKSALEGIKSYSINLLKDFHKNNFLKKGMVKEEFKNKIENNPVKANSIGEDLLLYFESIGEIKFDNNFISAKNFEVEIGEKEKKIIEELNNIYRKSAMTAPKNSDVILSLNNNFEEYLVKKVYEYYEENNLIKLNEGLAVHFEELENIKEGFRKKFKSSFSLSEARDFLGTNRKFALALLEKMDSMRFTKREGEKRVIIG